MKRLLVEYNHIGHASRFRIRLFRSEREGLGVGDIVLVIGDSVEPRQARVIALVDDGREAELEFLALTQA